MSPSVQCQTVYNVAGKEGGSIVQMHSRHMSPTALSCGQGLHKTAVFSCSCSGPAAGWPGLLPHQTAVSRPSAVTYAPNAWCTNLRVVASRAALLPQSWPPRGATSPVGQTLPHGQQWHRSSSSNAAKSSSIPCLQTQLRCEPLSLGCQHASQHMQYAMICRVWRGGRLWGMQVRRSCRVRQPQPVIFAAVRQPQRASYSRSFWHEARQPSPLIQVRVLS